jgi:hypothetical protein
LIKRRKVVVFALAQAKSKQKNTNPARGGK